MILDREALRQSLFGLVGFNSNTNPNYPNLAPSLLESRSGRRVNEVHPLLNDNENIDQSIKNFGQYVYAPYSAVTNGAGGYTTGSKVESGGLNYEYINASASTGDNPPPDATYWRQIDEYSDYLIKQVYAGIDQMLDDWINDKKIRTIIKSIFNHVLLYNGVANYRSLVPNRNDFVGLRIIMKRGERSLATIINRIGHQFSSDFEGLTLYLYHSSQQTALATYTIDHAEGRSSQWTTPDGDNIIKYYSDNHDAGGEFFLGYKQSQLESLGAQALRMDLNWNKPPCDCDDQWYEWYQQYTPFLSIVGFEIDESDFGPGDTLFDPEKVSVTQTNNYGLNLDLSIKCDIGYFIEQEEQLFAEALNNSIGMKLMQALAYNTRGGNQLAVQVKSEAKKELFHSQGVYGTLFDKYRSSIKALEFDLSGLGEHCFPCDDGSPDIIIGTATLKR